MRIRASFLVVLFLVSHSPNGVLADTFIDRTSASDLRIMTWNVNFDAIFPDTNATRATKFARVMNSVSPDVLCLEEIYSHSQSQLKALMDSVQPLGTAQGWNVYLNGSNAIVSKYSLSLQRNNTSPAGFSDVGMALVDLPNAQFSQDLYLMVTHYKCCDGFDPQRQMQSDAFVNWMRDARTAGGSVTLSNKTPMVVMGDLNLVNGQQPLTTLLNGDIQNNSTFGVDSAPDWDGTTNSVVTAFHNFSGCDTYTWRDDEPTFPNDTIFPPGKLDFITYTDSVLSATHSYVLNTTTMTPGDLAAAGLQTYDSCYDDIGSNFDHLPVVVDFAPVPEPGSLVLFALGGVLLLRRITHFRRWR